MKCQVNPQNLNQLSRTLKELRTNKGISQEQLAVKMKQDRSYISRIENGHKTIGVDTFISYLAGLDCHIVIEDNKTKRK
jgi:transcriptional regulator with XRE-family HTH domain